MLIAPGATSQSVDVTIVDDAGLPVLALVAATFPATTYSVAGPNADVGITLADLALITTAYASGGVKERGNGVYRLDLPNAALAAAGRVRVRGEATGKRLLCDTIDVQHASANVAQLLGTAWLAPGTAGTPDVNAKLWGGATVTGMPMPTFAQPTGFLAATFPGTVSSFAGGAVASVTARVTANADQLAGQTITAAAGVTFPASVASPTNITAGTISTVATLTTLPAIPANWLTAAGIAAAALNGKGDWSTVAPTNLTAAQIAAGIWQDAVAGDFTVALSVGKSVMNGVALGTGLTVASVSGAVASVTGAVGSVTAGVTVATNNDKTGYALTVAPPTAAAVATTLWQDLLAGADFGTAGSIGALLKLDIDATISSRSTFAGGAVASVTGAVGSVAGLTAANLDVAVSSRMATYTQPTGFLAATFPAALASPTNITAGTVTTVTNQLTAAAIAAGIWQDAVAGDFTVASSVGKAIYNAFTANTSVYTVASLANAPTGGSAPTAAQIATAVWTDLLAGTDFGTAASIGALLKLDIDATVSSRMATFTYTAPVDVSAAVAAVAAQLVKALAALYDTAGLSGSVVTLSNGATLTYSGAGRVRVGG